MQGVLSDRSIRTAVEHGVLGIQPFDPQHVQSCSYDMTVQLEQPLCLSPGVFHLLSTVERVTLPANVQGQIHGRSSLGRLGVLVHFTAGFIDAGFDGQITLEVMAMANAVVLRPGDRVCQVAFLWLDQPAERPYRGRYQHQVGVTPSRFEHGEA